MWTLTSEYIQMLLNLQLGCILISSFFKLKILQVKNAFNTPNLFDHPSLALLTLNMLRTDIWAYSWTKSSNPQPFYNNVLNVLNILCNLLNTKHNIQRMRATQYTYSSNCQPPCCWLTGSCGSLLPMSRTTREHLTAVLLGRRSKFRIRNSVSTECILLSHLHKVEKPWVEPAVSQILSVKI